MWEKGAYHMTCNLKKCTSYDTHKKKTLFTCLIELYAIFFSSLPNFCSRVKHGQGGRVGEHCCILCIMAFDLLYANGWVKYNGW